MELKMKERQKIAEVLSKRYKAVSKKEKKAILDEFVALTGYDRCYASYVLRMPGRQIRISSTMTIVGDSKKHMKRIREKEYNKDVEIYLKKIWYIMDFICGKRLHPILPEVIPLLEKHKEIQLSIETRDKLLKISASTIDRVLSKERKKLSLKGKSYTKPGSLLRNQIPIKTFSEWDDKRPGFVEIDLVGHDGGDGRGEFCQTLDVTDVSTGWAEMQAVKNKAEKWVFEAIKDIRNKMPFALCGIHSDNGGEFINHHLVRYCINEKITFTRSRSYKKNDNCYVEQKNYSIIRRAVGYLRHDTKVELELLNELYGYLRLYVNFFQPIMKLVSKTRTGSKVSKAYDTPSTPYHRALESEHIPAPNKEELQRQYSSLNPAELKRNITRLQEKLQELAILKEAIRKQNVAKPKDQDAKKPG